MATCVSHAESPLVNKLKAADQLILQVPTYEHMETDSRANEINNRKLDEGYKAADLAFKSHHLDVETLTWLTRLMIHIGQRDNSPDPLTELSNPYLELREKNPKLFEEALKQLTPEELNALKSRYPIDARAQKKSSLENLALSSAS
jgi:hypothetical protein